MQVSEEKLESIFTLLVSVNRLFAEDETEHANLLVTGLLKERLGAVSVALFYEDGDKGYRFCLSGSQFPIGLDTNRWNESLVIAQQGADVHHFGPWSLPGFDDPVQYWISLRLFGNEKHDGYLLLGRNKNSWNSLETTVLVYIAEIISTVVGFRLTKTNAENARRSTEIILQKNERRLGNLFDGSPDMIYTADADDRITNLNHAGVRLLGLQDAREVIGKQVSSLSANPEARPFELERVVERGYSADNEIILRHTNGTAIFCIESTTILRDSSGKTIEIQGIIKDITQRIISERELWRSTLELVDANKKLQQTQALMVQHEKLASIGQLAAGVAHEINNPLGFLKSNQTMIEKYIAKIKKNWDEVRIASASEEEEAGIRNKMSGIFSELEMMAKESADGFNRIIRIVTDLKSFSRIDQGSGFELVDINAGIESTLVVAWNEIKYVAEVTKDFGELPQVRARGSEINQVILNILVNAAQAIQGQARPEKGLIHIATSVRNNFVRIELHDDGPGIPEEIRSRIFEPFFTTKEPGKGTGLGLSISYNIIVNKHSGKFYLDPKAKTGTTFVIELPVNGPTAVVE